MTPKIQRPETKEDLGALLEGDVLEAEIVNYQGHVIVMNYNHFISFLIYEGRGKVKIYAPTSCTEIKDGKLIDRFFEGRRIESELYIKSLNLINQSGLFIE